MSREAVLAQSTNSPKEAPRREPPRASETDVGIIDDILAQVTAWIERANREYQAVVVNQLSVPTEKGLAADKLARAKASPQGVVSNSALESAQGTTQDKAPGTNQPGAAPLTETVPTEQRPSEPRSTDPATLARQRSAEAARVAAANPPASRSPVTTEPSQPPQAATSTRTSEPAKTAATTSIPAPNEPKPNEPKPEAPKPDAQKSDARKNDPSSRPAALADAATKAGDSILRSLERGEPVAPNLDPDTNASTDVARDRKAFKLDDPISAGRRCKNAGRLVDPPAYYTVKRGDTLWHISPRHYAKGHRFPKIVRANRGRLSDPDLIFPCQRVFLP